MVYVYLRLNELETEDDLFQFGQETHNREFYDVKNTLKRPFSILSDQEKVTLTSAKLIFSAEALKHERRIYAFFDLIGDLGGVLEIATLIFGCILVPIAEHAFIKAAAKTFFIARTSDESLFKQINEDKDNNIPKVLRKSNTPDGISE